MFRDKFYGIVVGNLRNVWVVGHLGKIFHSHDEGVSWEIQKTNVLEPIYSVDFVDSYGWAVGNLGLILHTLDRGTTWERQSSGTDRALFCVDFVDKKSGWAVGYYGTIIHTSNQGQTWESLSIREDITLNGVDFIDHENGWVVGEFGTILHTTNGGKSWERQHGVQEGESIDKAWSEVGGGIEDKTLFGVHFENILEGWVSGMDGAIAYTNDGGAHWVEARTENQKNLYDIKIKGKFGVAVGALGTIMISQDGGKEWRLLSPESTSIYNCLTSVDIIDENNQTFITGGGHGALFLVKKERPRKILGLPKM